MRRLILYIVLLMMAAGVAYHFIFSFFAWFFFLACLATQFGRSQENLVWILGVLRNFLCNVYAARKLRLQTTGNADGGGVSPHNFSLAPGKSTPEEIVRSVKEGLLLTRTLGHGLNSVTGDISRGAFGLWIENGEIAYPVSEITISGNLGALLQGIEMVGNDLEFLSPVAGPTIKVAGMTVAGE